MLNLVFLGPPGAGKGTISRILSGELNIPALSTGDIFRDEIASETDLGKKVQKIVSSGALVDDETVAQIVKHRISKSDCQNGFILDGYPRTIPQAEKLEQMSKETGKKINAVVNLNVAEEELVKRISGRRKCQKCGNLFNVNTIQEHKGLTHCPECKEKLIQRDDDKPEIVLDRLKVYEKQTKPLLKFYSDKNILITVNGEGPVEQVAARTKSKILETADKK